MSNNEVSNTNDDFRYDAFDIETNKYGVNIAIKAHILDDDKMRKIGFTDKNPDTWYFCKSIRDYDLSFNVIIPKNGGDINIMVFDEVYGHVYDYQYILEQDPEHKIASIVQNEVEGYMKRLQENGVLSGHNPYDRI